MKRRWFVFAAVIILILAAAVVGYWRFHPKPVPPLLPTSVTDDISFVIYLPSSEWHVNGNAASYQSSILSFSTDKDSAELTVTEQATPDVFNDVPQYFPSLLDKLNKYATIGSVNGTAYLTKPTELKGAQQVVLNNNGTLLFIHPNHDLSNDDWRRFINNLVTVKPS